MPKVLIAEILIEQKNIGSAIIKYMEAIFDPNNYTKVGLNQLKALLVKNNMNDVLLELENTLKGICKDKDEIKSRIKDYINSNSLDKAKDLIETYEGQNKDDVEIYNLKAIIAIMENDLVKAENLVDEGLLLDAQNQDVLFNKAYLYQIQGKNKEAMVFYKKALDLTKDDEARMEIESVIDNLSEEMEIIKEVIKD